MRTRGHHKRVLLFLIAVVLPRSVLIALTWRMQELREKRVADERRWTGMDACRGARRATQYEIRTTQYEIRTTRYGL